MCKAIGCKEMHNKHYCCICGDSDANHLAKNCFRGTSLYHGTRTQHVQSILKNGLQKSANGRMGPGLYLTYQNYAQKIAKYREGAGVQVVIEIIAKSSDLTKGSHPPWAGIKDDFPEWVINTNNYRVVKVHVYYPNGTHVEATP